MRTAQDIILKPVITEDSMDRLQANRYTFKVAKGQAVRVGFSVQDGKKDRSELPSR